MQGVNYDCFIQGPILITAPHSASLNRGGPEYGETESRHLREWFTSIVALRVAAYLKLQLGVYGSVCVWKPTHRLSEGDLDPNYLLAENAHRSPFHCALHAFALSCKGKPLLHVDIHGKMDCSYQCEIQVGIEPMRQYWEEDEFRKTFANKVTEGLDLIFADAKLQHRIKSNYECKHNAFWGGGIMTMTEQATLLGIPSMQLQLPLQVRKLMLKQPVYCQKIAQLLTSLYSEIVAPWWQKRLTFVEGNPDLACNVRSYILSELQDRLQIHLAWQQKNAKKNMMCL